MIYDWLIEGRRDLKIKQAFILALGVIGAMVVCAVCCIDWIVW